MNRKRIIILSIAIPIIVGLIVSSPLIYNWQRNKELVDQKIEFSKIKYQMSWNTNPNLVPPEIRNANYLLMKKMVDDEFIPVIYFAFGFSYCVTLLGVVSIYLCERKEDHRFEKEKI